MSLRWMVPLLMCSLVGCGPAARGVRLEPEGGEPVIRPLPARSTPVEVSAEALGESLAALVLHVPLSVRPAQAGRLLLASAPEDWERVDRTLQYALRRDYGRWCEQREAPGDCLSLLEEGLGFDDFDRLRVAVAFALDPAWEGVTEAVREVADPRVLKAMVVSAMAAYVLLLALPEPVLTKGVALVLTAYLVAYLGAGPFLEMTRACMDLRRETLRATTFTALEEAGARFGRVMGMNSTRVAILLVTAALGSKPAGLATRGPGLPGFARAAAAAEAELGIMLPTAPGVRSIAVSGKDLVIGLAPGAVAMATQDSGGGGAQRRTQQHHIATNKNEKSTLRGGPWTPRFRELFDKAGMKLRDVENRIPIESHKGPHPEAYHREVYQRMQTALRDCPNRQECRRSLVELLDELAAELATSGSKLNRLVTEGM
jgi:hypothetical protein